MAFSRVSAVAVATFTLLLACIAPAVSQNLTVTVCGVTVVGNIAPFTQGNKTWVEKALAEQAFSTRLTASAGGFTVQGQSGTVTRLERDSREFVAVEELAEVFESSVKLGAGRLDVFARLTDVRYKDGQLRVDTTIPVRYQVNRLNGPKRIYIDLLGVLVDEAGETRSEKSRIRSLRIGQFKPDTARITAETSVQMDYRVLSSARTNSIVVEIPSTIPVLEPATPAVGQSEASPAQSLSISSVSIEALDHLLLFTVQGNRPAAPMYGSDMAKGEYWLAIDGATISAPETRWQLQNALAEGVSLIPSGTPEKPAAKLIVKSSHVLVSRILSGPNPNSFTWQLALPKVAGGDWKSKIVLVDPGHGGSDSGAVANSLREKDLVLAKALAIRSEAKKAGLKVILTRDKDVTLTLRQRTDMIARYNADIFISVHNNSSRNPNSASGTEVFYHMQQPESRALAQITHDKIVAAVGTNPRRAKSDSTLYNSGLFVLRNSPVPAILIEVGFMNHAQEAARLRNPEFQGKVAKAVVDSVIAYLRGSIAASAPPAPAAGPEEAASRAAAGESTRNSASGMASP